MLYVNTFFFVIKHIFLLFYSKKHKTVFKNKIMGYNFLFGCINDSQSPSSFSCVSEFCHSKIIFIYLFIIIRNIKQVFNNFERTVFKNLLRKEQILYILIILKDILIIIKNIENIFFKLLSTYYPYGNRLIFF